MRSSCRWASLFALLAGCASSPPSPPPAPSTPPPPAAPSTAASAAQPDPEPEPKKQLPNVQIVNLCKDVAVLAYGEPPNMKPDALGRFAGDGNEGSVPRERDGTLAVTLVDDQGNALSKVTVSRRMKKLEIGRSCRTLYAH
jgi:hypothetical protein